MKKTTRMATTKLKLSTETIQQLTPNQMRLIAGGAGTTSDDSACGNRTPGCSFFCTGSC
jgi:hypothetical protein